MNTESKIQPTHRSRVYSLMELVGALLMGIGIGIIISDRVIHNSTNETVGMTFLLTTLIFGGGALHQFATRRRNQAAA